MVMVSDVGKSPLLDARDLYGELLLLYFETRRSLFYINSAENPGCSRFRLPLVNDNSPLLLL